MAIDIVHLNQDNSEFLGSVAEDVFDENINFDYLAKYVTEENHIMLVALHEEVVIGQVISVIHRHPDKPTELYVDDLGVSPKFQRQGVATLMLKELLLIARERGCKEIWVATEPDNEQAKGFYSSLNLSTRTALIFEGDL